jgi:sugar lactone lactonase YvrE
MSFSTYTSGLNIANGITFDNDNNLYIADGGDDNIIKVDILGNKTIFASGFSYIQNIVFDNIGFPNGYLYVMDDGVTLYKVDVNGNKTNFITNLNGHYFGMGFDTNNNLYYTSVDNNIYKIDTNGNTSTFINGSGTLYYPIVLAFDSNGDLLINSNQYITKYDSTGTLINAAFISIPKNVRSLIIDKNNNIYVTYNANFEKYINKYDSNGNLISTIYNDTNPTKAILGLAFDSIGNLYFTNDNRTIITKYTILLPITCFKEDTKILTDKGYKAIQDLRKGDLVKTLKHDFKSIDMIGKREIYHPALQTRIKDQLYKCCKDKFSEIFEPLVITGCHSILIDSFTSEEQKEKVIEVHGKIYVTDNKYRLPACCDYRASIYEIVGNYTIYHLALENDDYYMNYGIYANGLLVETCSKRCLKELSNMTLIE